MSTCMKFYDDDHTYLEVGKSFSNKLKIFFDIEGEDSAELIFLDKEDVHRLIGFLSSLLQDMQE